MLSSTRICIIALAMGAGLAGCAAGPAGSNAPPPLPPGARTSALSETEAAAARKLYVIKCARCHRFYDPAKYGASEWEAWMTKMSRKAKLKPAQEELLSRYLDAYRVEVAAKLKQPNAEERKFEDMAKDAERASVLAMVF